MNGQTDVARVATGLDGERDLGYEVADVGANEPGADDPPRCLVEEIGSFECFRPSEGNLLSMFASLLSSAQTWKRLMTS